MDILFTLQLLIFLTKMCTPIASDLYTPQKVQVEDLGDFLVNFDLVQLDNVCPSRIVELYPFQLDDVQKKLFYNWTPIKKQKVLNNKLSVTVQDVTKKYLNQCETLIISIGGTATEIQSTVEKISNGVGRPAKDYYLFIAQDVNSFEILYTLLPPRTLSFALFVHLNPCNVQMAKKDKYRIKLKNKINKCESQAILSSSSHSINIPQLRRKGINLNGIQLDMTAVHIPPLIMINKKTRRPFAGMMYNLYTSASKQFNITFNILGGLEGTGRILPNKTWTGMVGDLMYRRYDLSATMRVTPHRYGLIDVTEFMWQDPPVFITALPKGSIPLAAIIHPFTPRVWLMITLSFIAILPAIYISIITTRFMEQMDLLRLKLISEPNLGSASQHVYHTFMIPFGLALDQGITIPDGAHFLSGLWMLFVIVMGTGYKDKLFAFLTFPEPDVIPTNILELHERTDYRIIFHYWKSALFNLFNTSDHQVHKDLVKRFILEPNVVQCILMAVFESKTVCIAFKSLASLTLASNTTLISEFDAAVFSDNILLMDPMYIGIGTQKNSILTEKISTISSMFRDTGFLSIWEDEAFRHFKMQGKHWLMSQTENKIFAQLTQMIYDFFTPVKPLETSNFYVSFTILIVLLLISAIPFAHELKYTEIFKTLLERYRDRARKKKPKSLHDQNLGNHTGNATGHHTIVSLDESLNAIHSANDSQLSRGLFQFRTKTPKNLNQENLGWTYGGPHASAINTRVTLYDSIAAAEHPAVDNKLSKRFFQFGTKTPKNLAHENLGHKKRRRKRNTSRLSLNHSMHSLHSHHDSKLRKKFFQLKIRTRKKLVDENLRQRGGPGIRNYPFHDDLELF